VLAFSGVVIHEKCYVARRVDRAPIDINPRPETFGTTCSLAQVCETEAQRAEDFVLYQFKSHKLLKSGGKLTEAIARDQKLKIKRTMLISLSFSLSNLFFLPANSN